MRKNIIFIIILFFGFGFKAAINPLHEIKEKENGFIYLNNTTYKPDQNGVIASQILEVPEYLGGYFFATDSLFSWHYTANRVQPWFFEEDINRLFSNPKKPIPSVLKPVRNGFALLFHLKTGEYLYLLPVADKNSMSWIEVNPDRKIYIKAGTLGTQIVNDKIPLIIWAKSTDVFSAINKAWSIAAKDSRLCRQVSLRNNKEYNEPFRYLGWCSWEQYKRNINEGIINQAYTAIEKSDIPIRWFLVDDGHQESTPDEKLISFEPSPTSFPHGWQFLNERKNPDKIKWTGLWHAFNGLWNGVATDNKIEDVEFRPFDNRTVVTKGDEKSANAFYQKMISTVKKQGFDFVKVDIQSKNLTYYLGSENAVASQYQNSHALEEVCKNEMNGLINCMAMNTACAFNWKYSPVSRVSIDYKLGDLQKAKAHIYQSYASTLWLGQIIWPDYDMFHSSDTVAGEMMAISKAMSAGPVYLSDDPKHFNTEYIKPLCYENGEIIRPLAPAIPTTSSLFVDVFNTPNALKTIAPLSKGAAAMVIYNITEPSQVVKCTITKSDYQDASAMMQPYPGKWKNPNGGLIVYDWKDKKVLPMQSKINFDLSTFSDKLLLLCPKNKGWAIIGRADKYLSPETIKSYTVTNGKCKLTMNESGPLLVYNQSKIPETKYPVKNLGNGLYEIDLPIGIREFELTIQ